MAAFEYWDSLSERDRLMCLAEMGLLTPFTLEDSDEVPWWILHPEFDSPDEMWDELSE
jgi:hypothetical protein